jgi:hypothetical protein
MQETVMFMTVAVLAIALQGSPVPSTSGAPNPLLHRSQYRVYAHPPPCGDGWDLSARDGLCYPNGYLPPQEQAARRYPGSAYRGGRYPVPCGNGADVDTREGLCYPNGTVPPQFQQGRINRGPQYYGDDEYYERRPRRQYRSY